MQKLESAATAEPESMGGLVVGDEVCPFPAASVLSRCPVCGRADALVAVGDALYCAGCGYASDGAAGCT